MRLLTQGYGIQPKEWQVDELTAIGYSRVYYITSGEVFYKTKLIETRLEVGKLYIFPSHGKFQISHSPQNPICCLWFHIDFSPDIVNSLVEIPVTESLKYLLLSLKSQFETARANSQYFISMVSALVCYFKDNDYLEKPDEQMASVLSFMNEKYKTSLSIEQVAAHFNYTTEHFIRRFQKHVNITPFQYLYNCRMNEAVRLLSEDMSVLEISLSLGYSDPKAFSHAFKQKFGVAPSKYMLYYKHMA